MIGKWSRAERRRRATERIARQQEHREELAAAHDAADRARLAQSRLAMVREELVTATAPLRALPVRPVDIDATLTLVPVAARPAAARVRPFVCPFVPLAN